MKNLEQIRAAQALSFWANQAQNKTGGKDGGDVINKLPGLIINNGLLATLAFAKAKGEGHERLAKEICRFLCDPARGTLPVVRPEPSNLDPYIQLLTSDAEATSHRLQAATAEALAYLAYLKRFAP